MLVNLGVEEIVQFSCEFHPCWATAYNENLATEVDCVEGGNERRTDDTKVEEFPAINIRNGGLARLLEA
jgi:hypothetical protein